MTDLDAQLSDLAIFPLPGIVLFPHTVLALHIFEPRYRAMVRDLQQQARPLAMAQIDASAPPVAGQPPPVHTVLGVGTLHNVQELPDGRFLLELLGRARVKIIHELAPERPYRRVRAERLVDREPGAQVDQQVEVLRGLLLALRDSQAASAQLLQLLSRGAPAQELADVAAHLFISDSEQRQNLLEELSVEKRLSALIDQLGEQLAPQTPARTDLLN